MAGLGPEPGQVVERLEARRQAMAGFVMQGEIVAQGPGGELSGEQRILGRSPGRLRAEVMGPFGKPVLLLISDGHRLMVLAHGENKAYVGPASRQNIARFLGMALTSEEAYALLGGSVPLVPQRSAQVFAASQAGRAVLQLGDGAGLEQGLIFSPADYTVYEAWLKGPDGLELSMRFDAFVQAQGYRLPRRLTVKSNDGRSLWLNNDQMTANPPLDPALFEPLAPQGVEVVDLP